jgi:hypothetical protein
MRSLLVPVLFLFLVACRSTPSTPDASARDAAPDRAPVPAPHADTFDAGHHRMIFGALQREYAFIPDAGMAITTYDDPNTGRQDVWFQNTATPPATPYSVTIGGTGNSTLTQFSVLMGAGVGAIVQVSPSAAAYALVSNGTGSYASFQQLAYSSLSGTPTLPTVSGGTGISVSGGPAYTVTNTGVTSVTGGTGISCSPTTGAAVCTNSAVVTWANDLVGSTNTAQYVAAISGNSGGGGNVPINATSLYFAASEVSPLFGQSNRTTDAVAYSVSLSASSAWSSASTNINGGSVAINSGDPKSYGVTGRRGDVEIAMGFNGYTVGVQVVEPVINQRVVALAPFGGAISSTQMPTNTGDGVVYLANAVTTPTANPVSGGIVYESSGAFEHRGTGGADEQTAGAGEGTVNTQLSRRRRRVCFLRTVNSTLATMCTYTLPASGTHVVTIESMVVGTDTTTIANSGTERLEGNFSTNGTTATRIGTDVILYQSNNTQFSTAHTISGNTVQIQVSANNTTDSTAFVDIYEN